MLLRSRLFATAAPDTGGGGVNQLSFGGSGLTFGGSAVTFTG